MSDDVLPVTIRVIDADKKVIDVIYGNEGRNVLKIGDIINTIKEDPITHEKRIGQKYKITKIEIKETEIKETEVEVDMLMIECIIIG